MAGYVIHTPPGLSKDQESKATELGPSDVTSSVPIGELVTMAGFKMHVQTDVTDVFRKTCQAILEVREKLAKQLRAEEGDEFYNEEQAKKQSMLIGIDSGLLKRSFYVVSKT